MPHFTDVSRRSFMLMPLAAGLAGCNFGEEVLRLTGLTMGTTYNVVALGSVDQADLQGAVNTALAEVNASMSNWDAASEISRFNAQSARAEISAPLQEVMDAAEAIHIASEGTFDTTMGPLIELWGFGAPGSTTMPGDAQIEAALARSGHGNTLLLGGGELSKKQSDAQVYLAAIGKGYGADHVGRAIEALGITDYMIEIGGDLYASGVNPDGNPWQIGVEAPDSTDRAMLNVVAVSGKGVASSGDYRNYFEQNGQRFSHVINPVTGRPITHRTASATVIADNAMLADAWATAMLILGAERGIEIADREGLAVQFVERDPSNTDIQFQLAASAAFNALT